MNIKSPPRNHEFKGLQRCRPFPFSGLCRICAVAFRSDRTQRTEAIRIGRQVALRRGAHTAPPLPALAELPEHLADMAAFTLATGLRASNVTGLQWSQVDVVRRLAWIHPDQKASRVTYPTDLYLLNYPLATFARPFSVRHAVACQRDPGIGLIAMSETVHVWESYDRKLVCRAIGRHMEADSFDFTADCAT